MSFSALHSVFHVVEKKGQSRYYRVDKKMAKNQSKKPQEKQPEADGNNMRI